MTQPTHGLDPNALEAATLALNKLIVAGDGDTSCTLGISEVHVAITAYIAALSQNPGTSNTSGEAVGVKVKPLEWRKRLGDQIAWSECGVYEVGPTLLGDKLFIANRRTIDKDGSWLDQVLLRSATSMDEAKAAAQADYEARILAALEPRASDREAVDRRGVRWQPRGIGSNWNIPDLITGVDDGKLHPDMSGFVHSKAEGELAVDIFGGNAFLDWRPSEPKWIQVKVSAPEPVLVELERLVRANDNLLTPAIVAAAIRKLSEVSHEH